MAITKTESAFAGIEAQCVLQMTDGSLLRFSAKAKLETAKELDDIGAEIGAAVSGALSVLGSKVKDAQIANLTAELERTKQIVATMRAKAEEQEVKKTEPTPVVADPEPVKEKKSAKSKRS